MTQIHLRIADLRRQKKVTQQELADRVGVSYQTVSRWETGAGEPELSLLAALAEYFQVSVDTSCAPGKAITTKIMWNF